jgi:hypothetical protein
MSDSIASESKSPAQPMASSQQTDESKETFFFTQQREILERQKGRQASHTPSGGQTQDAPFGSSAPIGINSLPVPPVLPGANTPLAGIMPHTNLPRPPGLPPFPEFSMAGDARRGEYAQHSSLQHPPVPPPDPPKHTPLSPCIASYISLCRPFELPAPWSCCTADRWSLIGPTEPRAALNQLIAQQGEQAVLDSGLARIGSDGQIALHPSLGAPDVPLIVLRDSMTGGFRDIVTESGCVISDRLPLFEVLADKHSFDTLMPSRRFVLLARDIRDAVILRSLGLAAAPITGVCDLTGRDVEWLGKFYGVKREPSLREREEAEEQQDAGSAFAGQQDDEDNDADLKADAELPPSPFNSSPRCAEPRYIIRGSGYMGTENDDHVQLVLVKWSVHEMSLVEPAVTLRAVTALNELYRYRQVDVSEMSTWRPSDDQLAAIRFGLSRQEARWATDALLDSLHGSMRRLEVARSSGLSKESVADLESARKALDKVLFGGSGTDGRHRVPAVQHYVQTAGDQLCSLIMRRAKAATNPVELSLLLQFADLNALFLGQAPLASENVLRGLTQGVDVAQVEKQIKSVLALSNKLVTVGKELSRCKTQSSTPPRQPRAIPMFKSSPRFGNSDLVKQN